MGWEGGAVTYRHESREALVRTDRRANEQRVLAELRICPAGLTCDQFIERTGIPHQTASPAFTHLEQRGLIIRTDLRRATRTGSMAAVYMFAEPGTLFSRPRPARADAMRAVIRAAIAARATGDWGDFDAAFGALPNRERERYTHEAS